MRLSSVLTWGRRRWVVHQRFLTTHTRQHLQRQVAHPGQAHCPKQHIHVRWSFVPRIPCCRRRHKSGAQHTSTRALWCGARRGTPPPPRAMNPCWLAGLQCRCQFVRLHEFWIRRRRVDVSSVCRRGGAVRGLRGVGQTRRLGQPAARGAQCCQRPPPPWRYLLAGRSTCRARMPSPRSCSTTGGKAGWLAGGHASGRASARAHARAQCSHA